MRTSNLICVLAISFYCVFGHPEITNITEETTVNEGDSVDLNCTVRDHGSSSLEWKKKNFDKKDDSEVLLALRDTLNFANDRYTVKIIPHENGTVIYRFNIKKVEAGDMGQYVCSINLSQKDKVTSSVTLFVKHSPIILESKTLAEHIVTEGQKLEAVCQAEGFPKPSISWKREENAIMPGGGQIIYGDTLIIKKSHRLDRGNYLCIADNQVGKPTKRLVRIDVEFPPKTFVPSPKRAQALGYYVTLECAAQGYPATSVNWFKDDVELKSGGNYNISTTANKFEITNSILSITNVEKKDFGYYSCVSVNKMGVSKARLSLFESTIPIPPYF